MRISNETGDKDNNNNNNPVFSTFQTIESTLFQVYQLAKTETSNSSAAAVDARLLLLSDNQIPVHWKKLWNGPRAATNYLKAMAGRALAAEQRISQKGTTTSVDLSTIFNVDTFLAALKLVAARDHPEDISTTEIALTLRIKGRNIRATESKDDLNSIAIAPLLIEGGLNWDETTGMLTKVRSSADNKPTLTPGLILVLSRIKSPANNYDDNDDEEEELVDGHDDGSNGLAAAGNGCIVPLYSNGNRDKLICSFRLPIERNLRALAIYSSLALIIPEQPAEDARE